MVNNAPLTPRHLDGKRLTPSGPIVLGNELYGRRQSQNLVSSHGHSSDDDQSEP